MGGYLPPPQGNWLVSERVRVLPPPLYMDPLIRDSAEGLKYFFDPYEIIPIFGRLRGGGPVCRGTPPPLLTGGTGRTSPPSPGLKKKPGWYMPLGLKADEGNVSLVLLRHN